MFASFNLKRAIVATAIVWALGLCEPFLLFPFLERLWYVFPVALLFQLFELFLFLFIPYIGARYYFSREEPGFVQGIILGAVFLCFSIIAYQVWNAFFDTFSAYYLTRSLTFFEMVMLVVPAGFFGWVSEYHSIFGSSE